MGGGIPGRSGSAGWPSHASSKHCSVFPRRQTRPDPDERADRPICCRPPPRHASIQATFSPSYSRSPVRRYSPAFSDERERDYEELCSPCCPQFPKFLIAAAGPHAGFPELREADCGRRHLNCSRAGVSWRSLACQRRPVINSASLSCSAPTGRDRTCSRSRSTR